jgi:PAS domain S-box-containing protein
VSPVIERYTGVPPADFIGRTLRELRLPPELAEALERGVRRVFETGRADRVTFRFAGSDGAGLVFEARLIPEFGGDGGVESVLSIASNTTEREVADAALRESKARLEFTLAAAHLGEWEIDVASGVCRHSSQYDRCFGHETSPAGWDLRMMLQQVHADDRDRVQAFVARCFETRADLAFECRVVWPDASVHWIDVQGSAYVSARLDERETARLRYLGIIADITTRKHNEATLRDADARKDEFLATRTSCATRSRRSATRCS